MKLYNWLLPKAYYRLIRRSVWEKSHKYHLVKDLAKSFLFFPVYVFIKILNISDFYFFFTFLFIFIYIFSLEIDNEDVFFSRKTVLTFLQVILESQGIVALKDSLDIRMFPSVLFTQVVSSLLNFIPFAEDVELAVLAGRLPFSTLRTQGLHLCWTKVPTYFVSQAYLSSAFNDFYGCTDQVNEDKPLSLSTKSYNFLRNALKLNF